MMSVLLMASQDAVSQSRVIKADSPLSDQHIGFNVNVGEKIFVEHFIVESCTRYVIVYCGDITEVVPITTDCRFIDDMVSDFIDRYFEECDEEQSAPEDP